MLQQQQQQRRWLRPKLLCLALCPWPTRCTPRLLPLARQAHQTCRKFQGARRLAAQQPPLGFSPLPARRQEGQLPQGFPGPPQQQQEGPGRRLSH